MGKKTKPAAPAIQITSDCERNDDGYGILPGFGFDHEAEHPRSAISELKARLLAGAYESREESLTEHLAAMEAGDEKDDLVEAWDKFAAVGGWTPLSEREGWILVAVLFVEDPMGAVVADAVALFARPAGITDPEARPRIDQVEQPGESGPGVRSEAPSDPVEKPEVAPSHQRRPGVFELLEWTEALVATVTNRVEKHGDEDKPAVSLGLAIETENYILDAIDPTLRHALYRAKDEAQGTLPDVVTATPVLRSHSLERAVLPTKHEGWTLGIDSAVEEAECMKFGGCKLSKFSVEPKQGGTVVLRFTVGTSDIDAERLGYLGMHHGESLFIKLHAPNPKFDAPRPSTAPTEPGATDLFVAQHGTDDAEPAGADDEDAAAHGGDEPPDAAPDGSGEREPAEEGAGS